VLLNGGTIVDYVKEARATLANRSASAEDIIDAVGVIIRNGEALTKWEADAYVRVTGDDG